MSTCENDRAEPVVGAATPDEQGVLAVGAGAAPTEWSPLAAIVGSRRWFVGATATGAMLGMTSEASATSPSGSAHPSSLNASDRQLLDRIAVGELVQRERSARDQHMWDDMAACYHPQSRIETVWFQGSGAEFVAATRRNLSSGKIVSLHQLAPSVVVVKGARALADTGCQLVAFGEVDGVAICNFSQVRLLWRAQKLRDEWLLMALNVIYIRDMLIPCNPNRVPKIDEAELAKYRPSYKYEAYYFAKLGRPTSDNLPGIDQPETVAAARAGDTAWLDAT